MRATLIVSLAGALVAATACRGKAGSDGWPNHPVKVIVPFGPGSGSDLVARLLAPRLSERWGQPVVIDNRPGADGVVGAQVFASATDRHTLLFTPAGQVTLSPLLHERLPYDPVRDLVPISAVVTTAIGIAAAKDVGAASLADVVSLARQQPDRYLWAAAPGLPEVLLKAFLAIERVEMKHVPYRDLSVAVQDLGAGRIHVGVFAVPSFMPLVQSGAVKLLAVTSSARIAAAPDVPTTTEAGYPMLSADGKWGFYGWRDIDGTLRERLSGDIRQALDDDGLRAKLSAMGLTAAPGSADEFVEALNRQRQQVQEIARIIGLKPPATEGSR